MSEPGAQLEPEPPGRRLPRAGRGLEPWRLVTGPDDAHLVLSSSELGMGWQARCVCGWAGPWRPSEAQASADGAEHLSGPQGT